MASNYEYQPLKSRHEIRLLWLFPAESEDASLRFNLVSQNRHSHHPYKTLSYTWGNSGKCRTAYVDGFDNGDADLKPTREFLQSIEYTLDITENLDTALRRLRTRQGNEVEFFWIDAVCINQTDLAEREHQVQMMRDIYANASQTIIWLGDADPWTRDAISCITLLSWASSCVTPSSQRGRELILELEQAQQNPSKLNPTSEFFIPERSWKAFAKLLARPWFERVWVYQEVAVSDSLDIQCGTFSIAWDDLCAACQFVNDFQLVIGYREHEHLHTSVLIMKETRDGFRAPIPIIPDGASAPRTRGFQDSKDEDDNEITDQQRLAVTGQLIHDTTTCPRLDINLLTLRWAQATDPRDKVYALLGISSTVPAFLRPDYTISLRQAYGRTAKALRIIPGGSVFAFLSLVQHEHRQLLNLDLASWVPDWRRPLHAPWLINNFGFQAAYGVRADISQSADDVCLTAKGTVLMRIAVLGPQAGVKGGMPPLSLLAHLPNPYACSWSAALKDALDFETDPGGRFTPLPASACNTPFWEWRAKCKDSLAEASRPPPEPSEWEVSASSGSATVTVGPDTVQWDQLQGNSGIAQGRRVFISDLGYIGLAPLASMVGDEVCVLMGSKVPHIIRRDGSTYWFVGECYVYGLMDGEVMQGLDVERVGFLQFL